MASGASHRRRQLLGRAVAAAAGLLLVGALAVYWLFYDNRLSRNVPFPLDLVSVRAEAVRLPGVGPSFIEVETLSHQGVPCIAMEAGGSWSPVDLVRTSYRMVWRNRSVVLDTAYDEATASATGATRYDRAAWGRMQAAMEQASLILVTHEHGDHIGGLIASPHLGDTLSRALLTPEQFRLIPNARPQWPPGSRDGYRPQDYKGIRAVAPGVVLIRAAGHTPGSQMIYVRRADGHEYLFMGDTASLIGNVERQRIRSRLVTDFFTHEDRPAVMGQVMALHRLAVANPGLTLVPGHDGPAIAALVADGLLVPKFSEPPAQP